MALIYRKGLKLGPVRLNLSGSGIGVSVGGLGTRLGRSPSGRKYASTALGHGLRHIATLPQRKTPFPGGIVDLSGGDDFWFNVEGEAERQDEIVAAVAEIERRGGDQPIIPIYLFRAEAGALGVAVMAGTTYREVGTIPTSTGALRSLARRIGDGEASVGRCLALVFDDDGKLGLKLNVSRKHVEHSGEGIPPAITAIAVVGVFASVLKAIFGRRR